MDTYAYRSDPDAPFFARQALTMAGALAVHINFTENRFVLEGENTPIKLPQRGTWPGFENLIAPIDQPKLFVLRRAGRSDVRVRLIDQKQCVHFVRLIGSHANGQWTGVMLPAGSGPRAGLDRVEAEQAFRQGLMEGEMTAFYQPIIALDSHAIAGFEALARWHRPDYGLISPEDFFVLADDLNLIGAMGEAVRECALTDLSAWLSSGYDTIFTALNVSGEELGHGEFTETLLTLIAKAQIPPDHVKIEITETEVMRHPSECGAAIKDLRKQGVRVLLDDFGTGYSSLSRLDRFGVDGLKIDQYFTRAMVQDKNARQIVKSILKLARDLNLSVVAEGVEDQDTAHCLTDLGCTYAQGFYFDGALNPQAASTVLEKGRAALYKPYPQKTVIAD